MEFDSFTSRGGFIRKSIEPKAHAGSPVGTDRRGNRSRKGSHKGSEPKGKKVNVQALVAKHKSRS